jgi:hypothetical protein
MTPSLFRYNNVLDDRGFISFLSLGVAQTLTGTGFLVQFYECDVLSFFSNLLKGPSHQITFAWKWYGSGLEM